MIIEIDLEVYFANQTWNITEIVERERGGGNRDMKPVSIQHNFQVFVL